MRLILLTILLLINIYASDTNMNNPILWEEQRKKFEETNNIKNKTFKKNKEPKKLELSKPRKKEPCIKITDITFDETDLLSKKK